ncbi:hypothetical protein ACFU8W_42245 [Streptomyces sp. NPDC057565]|uniref:hypothetical protein n=1 Tax=Streptomyces sp. NPDC057565 TaxID=3346169 RepID=UPI00367D7BAB
MSAKFSSALVAALLAVSAVVVSVSGSSHPAPVRVDASAAAEAVMSPTDTGWQ